MTKYLGIDFGLAHIGLAISEHTLATPLSSLPNDPAIFSRLGSIVSENRINHIVCGLPDGPIAQSVQIFAKELSRTTGIPVILHDETLSTQEASAKLRVSGASRAKKKNDHSYAACLILEDYLELHPVLY